MGPSGVFIIVYSLLFRGPKGPIILINPHVDPHAQPRGSPHPEPDLLVRRRLITTFGAPRLIGTAALLMALVAEPPDP